MADSVVGQCPMGCGETLALDYLHRVYCIMADCPRQMATHEILSEIVTDHIIEVRAHDFTLKHPLRERLDGDLFDCHMHRDLHELDSAPVPVGRYAVTYDEDGELHFEDVP